MNTYQLNRPMNWQDFKDMPTDLQKQYLEKLNEEYAPTNDMLGEMFRVSNVTVYRKVLALGIPQTKLKLTREESQERAERWHNFVCGKVVLGEASAEESTTDAVKVVSSTPLEIRRVEAEFTGVYRPESLASWLAAFPIHGTPEVRIRVEVELI